MKKKILIVIILAIGVFIFFHEIKTHDLKNTFNLIVEKVKEKKPEPGTKEMVKYLKDKASKDANLNNESTIYSALKYIRNNIENASTNTKLENLIYYGYILQYSPKESDMGKCTTIGIKTVKAVSDVYVKDNDYKKSKNKVNKTEAQIIKVLISRVDKE